MLCYFNIERDRQTDRPRKAKQTRAWQTFSAKHRRVSALGLSQILQMPTQEEPPITGKQMGTLCADKTLFTETGRGWIQPADSSLPTQVWRTPPRACLSACTFMLV